MADGPRVAVIGLDCGTPQLLFDRLSEEVPNINALMRRGMHGDLASITPPITIPAWACAMSGKTPGQLAIYGMRNRKDSTYEGLSIATSLAVKEPQVWDVLGERGLRSLLIGVPPGYPPKPVNGWRVSCFLTPPSAPSFTHPQDLQGEIEGILGGEPYIFDIPNFREQGYEHVHDQLYKMTERRFAVARNLVRTKPWDYFMMVEMAADRLHHVFWDNVDPQHPKFEPGNRFESSFRDYYRFLDGQIASLLEALPGACVTILLSDRAPRRMVGGAPVGTGEIFTYENDTGPDGANHDRTGVFMMTGPGQQPGRREGLRLIDVGPSILSLYGLQPPEGAVGRSFL